MIIYFWGIFFILDTYRIGYVGKSLSTPEKSLEVAQEISYNKRASSL